MRKLIFLGAFLLIITILLTAARGQQSQAMLKIVQSNDGSVKVYDLQRHDMDKSTLTVHEPAAPTGSILSAARTDSAGQTGDATAAVLNPGPDLTFRFPPTASYSAPNLTLTTWIMNNGTSPSGACYVGYYLQPVLNPTMHIELGHERVDPLIAGESRQYMQTFNLNLHPGTWYVCWAVDYTFLVAEDNEANNVFITSNSIDLPGPNLALQAGYANKMFDESTDQLHITVRVINTGTVTAGSSVLAFYFGEKRLGDLPVYSLSPGSYSDKSVTISDFCKKYGHIETWVLTILLDETGAVVETDENDNSYILPIHLPCPHPNLTMQRLPNSFQYTSTTRQLDIRARVMNNGNAEAGSSRLGFYLSADTDITSGDRKLGTVDVPSLHVGAYSDERISIRDVSYYASSGTWYAGFIIDETNAVRESDETDNTCSFTPSITVNYYLTIAVDPASSGSVSKNPDKSSYDYNETVQLTANAAAGYQFDHWSGDLNGSGNPQNLSMKTDKSVTAYFAQVQETVSVPNPPTGSSSGYVGQSLSFSTGGSSSNLGHSIEYQFDWGDGSPSAWGPSTQSHSYSSSGTVSVKARARCQTHTGIVSGWSGTRPVTIEENSSVADILVTNCNDAGPGSLREAINIANLHTGPDTILFAIPEGVPGYRADAGIWVIQPKSDLPPISDDNLLINGFTQSAFIGRDTNPFGPEIVLEGRLAGCAIGIHVAASEVTIVGLTINHFRLVGIWMDQADHGYVAGCYIGMDYAGMEAAPNGEGINIGEQCHHIYIAPVDTFRNIITGNINCGIHVRSSHAIFLYGNLVGLNRLSSAAPGNGCYGGFYIAEHSDSVVVVDNWICGNTNGALILNSIHNTIQKNWIGICPQNPDLKPGDLIPLTGNRNDGISIQGESSDNLIYNNVISENDGAGVCIYGEQPLRNRISRNCIFKNKGPGIFYPSAGANRISAPAITKATGRSVSGTAIPNAIIEIFTDAEDEGQIFQGATQSGADGRYSWTGVMEGLYTNVTAIAIDAGGSTSQFSNVSVTGLAQQDNISHPQVFVLEQNYPNPFNPDTHIAFDIPQTAEVSLMIFDVQGHWISTVCHGNMQAGHYSVVWNGQNSQGESVPCGVYVYRLIAGNICLSRKMILVK